MASKTGTFRDFNRFYSSIITFLEKGLGNIPYSAPEMRVICELYVLGESSGTKILQTVKMHKGHLSRVLTRLDSIGLINLERKPYDRRSLAVSLIKKGREEAEALMKLFDAQIQGILDNIKPSRQAELEAAMQSVQAILGDAFEIPKLNLKPVS